MARGDLSLFILNFMNVVASDQSNKVLIFSTAYLPLIGGAELAVKNITDGIVEYQFDLITAKINSELSSFEQVGNVNVYRLGFGTGLDKLLLPILGPIKAIVLNKKNNYRIVWSIMASYGGLAGLLYKILTPKVKFLLTLQEGDDLSCIKRRVGIFYFIFRRIFVQADYIQVISNYLSDWAKVVGAKCPIEVVPNGVDLAIFRPKWQIENLTKKIIITVSRLVEKNGVAFLIEAMKDIDGELWIIGDGQLRGELEKLAQEFKLENRVKFFGSKESEMVAELLSQASVFVRPSLSEGLGNAFLEAMAVGVPTVGTSIGGIVDFLIDGQTGWICQVKSGTSIASTLNKILDPRGQDQVAEVVSNAKKMVTEKYDWQKISGCMLLIFEKLKS